MHANKLPQIMIFCLVTFCPVTLTHAALILLTFDLKLTYKKNSKKSMKIMFLTW